MTIDEAIRLLSEYVYEDKPCPIGLYDEATRLSIEALKRLQSLSPFPHEYLGGVLPGETKE